MNRDNKTFTLLVALISFALLASLIRSSERRIMQNVVSYTRTQMMLREARNGDVSKA